MIYPKVVSNLMCNNGGVECSDITRVVVDIAGTRPTHVPHTSITNNNTIEVNTPRWGGEIVKVHHNTCRRSGREVES